MKLIKTTFFSAIITLIRILSGFLSNKVIAYFVGPTGIAMVGQFGSFISIVLTFSNGAINNGIIKYTAEFKEEQSLLKKLFSTAFKITALCSLVIGIILVVFSTQFSDYIFKTKSYYFLIILFGITVSLYSFNTLLISILNGKGDIKKLTIANTVGVFAGLLFTVILVFFYKEKGALYALVLSQSVMFFFTYFFIARSQWFNISYFTDKFNVNIAKKLFAYSLMAIASAVTIPASQIFLRDIIITKYGVTSAGYWQAMLKISDGYLMIVITSLTTYYLPKLSSLTTDYDLRDEIFKGLKMVLPLLVILSVIIYLYRFFIIDVLYAKSFIEMEQLFLFQLLGDIFKIASWMIGYIMVAKAMTKQFVFSEIFFNVTFILLGYTCLNLFGFKGISVAFFLNYLICLVSFVFYFRRILFRKWNSR